MVRLSKSRGGRPLSPTTGLFSRLLFLPDGQQIAENTIRDIYLTDKATILHTQHLLANELRNFPRPLIPLLPLARRPLASLPRIGRSRSVLLRRTPPLLLCVLLEYVPPESVYGRLRLE